MHYPQERKSRKLESLPEDLRSLANELISEKFPEPKKEPATTTYIGTPDGNSNWEYWYNNKWVDEPSDYATNMRFRSTTTSLRASLLVTPDDLRKQLGLNNVGITSVWNKA